MDKKIKTILAVVVIAVVVVGALLFFVVFRDDKSKFIGTWELIEAIPPTLGDPENHSLFETYYNNNSLKLEIINKSTGEILDTNWWIFKVEFGKLYIGPNENYFSEPISYTFSNDDTELNLNGNVYSKIG